MNWRVPVGVLVGLALPVPLIWALAGSMFPHSRQLPRDAAGVSPVLTSEERSRLQSYHRKCASREDCEPPLACLGSPRARKHFCTDSQCATDAQCPEDFSCQLLPSAEGGLLVRYCIPNGLRQERESCLSIPTDQESACAPGLLCGKGWCGRPCRLDEPTSCPRGFFCAQTIPGPACQPTCEGVTCPEGQRCIRDEGGASACAVVYGQDCQREPCPEGRECSAMFSARPQVKVWMECFPECGADRPPCAEGLVCDRTTCRKPCEPAGPNVCEPGFRCQRATDRLPWLCHPDM
jgi:hypothetical protein